MPKGYWIARMDTTDPERYKQNAVANGKAFRKYGARFVIRAGRFESVEGKPRGRNVLIEFPSFQSALDCWNSPEYKEALKIREGISDGDIVVIEGYDGPQPSSEKGTRPGFWIARVDVHDMTPYAAYSAALDTVLKKHKARFLVRGGRFEAVEGKTRARHVVIEFPDMQTALDCWHSPEYQAALAVRAPVTEADIVVIESYDGPQP
jgi:uncharacterized protein (DUF1330 family)